MITNTAGMRNAIAEWSGTVGVETSQAHVNNAPRKKKMNARPPAPCKNAARARAEKARLAVKEWSGTVGVASSSDNANDVPSKTNTYAEHKSVIRRKGSLLGNARSARLALAEWSGVVGIGNDEDELDVDIPKTCRSSGYSTSSISTISSVSSCGSSDASTIDDFVYTTSTQRPPVNKHTSTKSSGPMRNVRLAFAEWSDTVGVGMADDNDDNNDAAAAAPAAHKATKAKSPSRSKSLRLALAEWSGTVRVSLDTDEEQHETFETRTTDAGSSQPISRPEIRKTKSARAKLVRGVSRKMSNLRHGRSLSHKKQQQSQRNLTISTASTFDNSQFSLHQQPEPTSCPVRDEEPCLQEQAETTAATAEKEEDTSAWDFGSSDDEEEDDNDDDDDDDAHSFAAIAPC